MKQWKHVVAAAIAALTFTRASAGQAPAADLDAAEAEDGD
jgi:hypothetical protein